MLFRAGSGGVVGGSMVVFSVGICCVLWFAYGFVLCVAQLALKACPLFSFVFA